MKKAFTLAEVLITLGIIGIVAAMTLPTLMVKKRNSELESSFKTAYSLISQAVLRMSSDNPNIVDTYCSLGSDGRSNYQFTEDFSKYFQTTRLYAKWTYNLKTLGYSKDTFLQANGKEEFNRDGHNQGAFFAKNGMMIAASGCWWSVGNNKTVDFIIDTNGIKEPNRFGYDVFYFQINKNNILLPSTHKYTFVVINSQLEQCCNFKESSTCTIPSDNGTACSHFALKNQYPQDENKSYWKSLQ